MPTVNCYLSFHILLVKTKNRVSTRVTNFIEFLETWKCRGNLAKIREKAQCQGKVREFV